MKKKLLYFLLCLVLLPTVLLVRTSAAPAPRDVSFQQMQARDLNKLGLLRGTGAGGSANFDLSRAPTRLEALIMLIRLLGKDAEALACTDPCPFTDVPQWGRPYAAYAYRTGLTKGSGAGVFGMGNADASMYSTFILRALGYDDGAGDFVWNDCLPFAAQVGILSDRVDTNTFLRADMVDISYEALFADVKGGGMTLADKLTVQNVFTEETFQNAVNRALRPGQPELLAADLTIENAEVYGNIPGTDCHWLYADGLLVCRAGTLPDADSANRIELLQDKATTLVVEKGITTLPSLIFQSFTKLEEAWLSSDLEIIHANAFAGCTSLKFVSLRPGLKTIRMMAFYACNSLETVVLPDGLTELIGAVFTDCTSLRSVYIPDGITSVGGFSGCTSLAEVRLPEGLESIDVRTFTNTAISEIRLPASLKGIGGEAFMGTPLTEVTLPEGLEFLGDGCFKDCAQLKQIHFPGSLIRMGRKAFINCTSLDKVVVNGNAFVDDNAFEGCTLLIDAVFTGYVSFNGWTFKGCSSLKTLTFKGTVKHLGGWLCASCPELTTVTFGGGIDNFAGDCFANCKKLSTVTFGGPLNSDGRGGGTTFRNTAITSVTIPAGTKYLPTGLFSGCDTLTQVNLPEGLLTMDFAFGGCKSLKSIKIPDSVTSMNSAFSGCNDGDIQFNIPKSMTVLNGLAGLNITSFTIPPQITAIGNDAFFYCPNLTSIVIPKGVKSIGDKAFAGCASLQSVTIPDTVTEIGEDAFNGCESIAVLNVPGSVKEIGFLAFAGVQEVRIDQKKDVIKGVPDVHYGCNKLVYLK